MKQLKDIIIEKLCLDKNLKCLYTCQPKDCDELRNILEKRLKKDKNADLNDIDVSQITNMSSLFYRLDPHNIKIDRWDVSNVKDMRGTFGSCYKFNSDISKWDVSNVIDMDYMFYNCQKFNANLSKWDVSNVKSMMFMFHDCKSLKNIPNWYKI